MSQSFPSAPAFARVEFCCAEFAAGGAEAITGDEAGITLPVDGIYSFTFSGPFGSGSAGPTALEARLEDAEGDLIARVDVETVEADSGVVRLASAAFVAPAGAVLAVYVLYLGSGSFVLGDDAHLEAVYVGPPAELSECAGVS